MSDHIAHLGICDDAFRLASVLPGIASRFVELMDTHREIAHMGAITRYADKWSVGMVHWAREESKKPEGERDPHLDHKIAFMLGSLTHRAADRLTKPITRCWPGKDKTGSGPQDGPNANESKIIQDVFVYREVYAQGRGDGGGLFNPTVFDFPHHEGADKAEMLYRTLLRRALIAMHTFNPDPTDAHAWMDKFFEGMQQYPKSLEQYRHLNEHWPADKVKLYLTDKHFYDAEDELIVLARKMQHGGTAESAEVKAAYDAIDADTSSAQSRYARALAKSLDYLLVATAAYRGEIDEAATSKEFEIGVPDDSLQK